MIAHEASIPNPKLAAFTPFIGTWTTVGTPPDACDDAARSDDLRVA